MSTESRLVRVLSEIGIIVVGVMIALAADGFRDSRLERQLTRSYLENLTIELREDFAEFAGLLDPGRLPAQQAATDSLIHILSAPDTTVDGATVAKLPARSNHSAIGHEEALCRRFFWRTPA